MKTLTMSLPRLPDMSRVGGNSRHYDWRVKAREWNAEQDAWIIEMGMMEIPQFEKAQITGPFHLKITLHFPTQRHPDFLNAAYALKPLEDLLEPWRIINNNQVTRGHLGWIADDNNVVWPWQLTRCVGCDEAPRTDVTVTEVEHDNTDD